MDKFGIFNLLNSFFSLSNQKNEDSPINSSTPEIANNLIASLGKNLFSPLASKQNSEQAKPKDITKLAVPLPLQKNMISTINSHDEFVKRVKQKHDKLTT